MSDHQPTDDASDSASLPEWPAPVARRTVGELMQLMRELDDNPEDIPVIVRDALGVAAVLAAGIHLPWAGHVKDCLTLVDARAGLLKIWDLLVRADAVSVGASQTDPRTVRKLFTSDHGRRDAVIDGENNPGPTLRPGRAGGYELVIAAHADARARLSPLVDGRLERELAQCLHDPWRVVASPEPQAPDKNDWYTPLA